MVNVGAGCPRAQRIAARWMMRQPGHMIGPLSSDRIQREFCGVVFFVRGEFAIFDLIMADGSPGCHAGAWDCSGAAMSGGPPQQCLEMAPVVGSKNS